MFSISIYDINQTESNILISVKSATEGINLRAGDASYIMKIKTETISTTLQRQQ